MAEAPYVATERLYLDKNGSVVDAKSPDRVELLVNEGGTLPYSVAVAHGLVQGDRDTQTQPNAGDVAAALAQAQADNASLQQQNTALKAAATKPASKDVLAENERLKAQVADLQAAAQAAAEQKAVTGPDENKVVTSGQVENK